MVSTVLLRDLDPKRRKDALRWVRSESRKATNEIGFVPYPRFEDETRRGRTAVTFANDDLVCFAYWGKPTKLVKIHQLYTRSDARRLLNAAATANFIERWAWLRGADSITLRCADDIAGNLFWPAIGYQRNETLFPANVRGRAIHVYEFNLRAWHAAATQSSRPASKLRESRWNEPQKTNSHAPLQSSTDRHPLEADKSFQRPPLVDRAEQLTFW